MLFVFGGEYHNVDTPGHKQVTRPGRHFGLVHPCDPGQTPYVYVGERAAVAASNLTKHHSHLYAVSDDLTTVTLHKRGEWDFDEQSPTEIVLDGQMQAKLRSGISKIIRESYDDECPDCGDDIPEDVADGDGCANCGHVFCIPQEDDGTS